MKSYLLILLFSFFALVSLAQLDSLHRNPPINLNYLANETFAEKVERLNIKPRKFKLSEYCHSEGFNYDCKKSCKRLSRMIRYCDRVNRRTRSSESKYGTWTYGINIIDENHIIISGKKAVGMVVMENYDFRRK